MTKKTTIKSNPQPKTEPNSSREIFIIKHKKGQTLEREYVPKQPSGSPAKSTR